MIYISDGPYFINGAPRLIRPHSGFCSACDTGQSFPLEQFYVLNYEGF